MSTEGTVVALEDVAGPSGQADQVVANAHEAPTSVPVGESATDMQIDNTMELPEHPIDFSEPPVVSLESSHPHPTVPITDLAPEEPSPHVQEMSDVVTEPNPPNLLLKSDEEAVIPAEVESSPEPAQPVIIIDVLDTPATRREKNMRRKAERLRTQQAISLDPPRADVGPDGQHVVDPDLDAHSELTALTSDEEDQGESPIQDTVETKLRVQDLGKIVLEKNRWLPHNTPGKYTPRHSPFCTYLLNRMCPSSMG